jgi:2-polyprenyl-6-methoxyphenol hydroxylase-like FAD-dependent oxidoreductase
LAIDSVIHYKKFDGTLLASEAIGDPGLPSMIINRSQLHMALVETVQSLGIHIEFNATGVDYFETKDTGGVILEDGRALTADVIVAADGIGSKAWRLVLGRKPEVFSSGSAVYRVTFPVGPALENPIIAKEFEGFKTKNAVFFGPTCHVIVGKTATDTCWMAFHKARNHSNSNLFFANVVLG